MTSPDFEASSSKSSSSPSESGKNAKQSKSASSKEGSFTDEVADTSKEVASTAKDVVGVAKHAVAEGKEQLSSAASAVVSRVEDTAGKVKERGQDVLHSAADKATDLYKSASETAHDVAGSASESAQAAGRAIRRAGGTSATFIGTHALPLTAVGVSLAWLAWSIRSQAQPRTTDVYVAPRVRTPRRDEPIERDYGPNVTDGTLSSPKLMGAPTIGRERSF